MIKKYLLAGIIIILTSVIICQQYLYVDSSKEIKQLKNSVAGNKFDTCFLDYIKQATRDFEQGVNGQEDFDSAYYLCLNSLKISEVLSELTYFQTKNSELHDSLHDLVVMMGGGVSFPIREDKSKVLNMLKNISDKPEDIENTKKLSEYVDYLTTVLTFRHFSTHEAPNYDNLTKKRLDKKFPQEINVVSPAP